MHILLLVFFLIAVIAFAPAKWGLAFCGLIVAIPLIVKATAQKFSGAEFTFWDSAKAVALALFLSFVFLLVLLSIGHGEARLGIPLLLAFFCSYVLGFKLSLGTSFGISAGIAAVSTVASGILVWLVMAAL
ncbi:hypothetical protein [Solilutibacter silvestris]|uniref:hypothetical protein n=1 Tax=Solilutibacter silvestris TaxID=1645665 RepID=UPI003D340DFC